LVVVVGGGVGGGGERGDGLRNVRKQMRAWKISSTVVDEGRAGTETGRDAREEFHALGVVVDAGAHPLRLVREPSARPKSETRASAGAVKSVGEHRLSRGAVGRWKGRRVFDSRQEVCRKRVTTTVKAARSRGAARPKT